MLRFLRYTLTTIWWLSLYLGTHFAQSSARNDLVMWSFGVALFLSIPVSAVWAPYLANALFGGFLGVFTSAYYFEKEDHFIEITKVLKRLGWRQMLVACCWIQGIMHPDLPYAFLVGMENAKWGSWLQRYFAWKVFRFDNAQNCRKAVLILESQGIRPGLHKRAEVNIILMEIQRATQTVVPDPPALPLPQFGKHGTRRLA